jgi:Rad3-related DNA helicase
MFDPKSQAKQQGWKGGDYLTVFDEADTLEDSILGFFEVSISMNYLNEIAQRAMLNTTVNGIITPYKVPIPPVRDFSKWMEWWIDVREMVEKALARHNPDPSDIPAIMWVNRLKKLKLALDMVECDWIYDPIRAKNSKGIENGPAERVILKPLLVGEMGKTRLWDFCGKTVCMSGSIVSLDVFAEENGLDKSGKSYELIRYETSWETWRRTIFRVPGVDVVKVQKKLPWSQQPFWDKYIANIAWILFRHPEDRYLIHAVSHDLAKELGKSLGEIFGNRIIVSQSYSKEQRKHGISDGLFVEDKEEVFDRDEALENYLNNPGKVLISASLARGTDLPGDACRGIIQAKIPWKSLGDRRIKARLELTESGKIWYLVQAVRDILQSFGRGVRGPDDWCRLWVVDDQFGRIVQMRGLLPEYFKKTIRQPDDYMDRGCNVQEKISKDMKDKEQGK